MIPTEHDRRTFHRRSIPGITNSAQASPFHCGALEAGAYVPFFLNIHNGYCDILVLTASLRRIGSHDILASGSGSCSKFFLLKVCAYKHLFATSYTTTNCMNLLMSVYALDLVHRFAPLHLPSVLIGVRNVKWFRR